jgi:hypothetical protein
MVAVDGSVWFRGARLWQATTSRPAAERFGNSWVKVTDPAAGFGWRNPLSDVPLAIPTNFFAPRADMVNLGRMALDGRDVVRIRNGSDFHDILATGTPYPIDWLETDEPGPDGQPCGVTISGFNAPATLTAPRTHLVDRAPA